LLPISRDNILIGWQDTTYGIDNITTSSFKTGYTGYFDSPIYEVGTNLNKRQFTEIGFNLVRPSRTNEGIRIAYRNDLTSSFTTINTWDFATIGAVQSFNDIANIPDCEFVQLRVYLTGTTTSPELRSVYLR